MPIISLLSHSDSQNNSPTSQIKSFVAKKIGMNPAIMTHDEVQAMMREQQALIDSSQELIPLDAATKDC